MCTSFKYIIKKKIPKIVRNKTVVIHLNLELLTDSDIIMNSALGNIFWDEQDTIREELFANKNFAEEISTNRNPNFNKFH